MKNKIDIFSAVDRLTAIGRKISLRTQVQHPDFLSDEQILDEKLRYDEFNK